MMDYEMIPEGAPDEIIESYLNQFLQESEELIKENGVLFTFEILGSITEKEVVYEYKEADVEAISDFIRHYLNYDDPILMDIILTIVIQMHLVNIWHQIIHQDHLVNEQVIALISDAIKENAKYLYFKHDE